MHTQKRLIDLVIHMIDKLEVIKCLVNEECYV